MFTVACVLSSIFALSALSIITNSCEERISASTFRSASMERMAQNYRMHSFYSSEDHSPSKKRKIDSEEIVIDDVFKKSYNTNLKNIVFGIAASSKLWQSRKYYVREWWQKRTMRGYVWLETPINGTWDEFAPPFKISANTSQFKYSRPKGNRAALRLTRIVTETFKLGLKNVDWFVMGDDDTIIFTDNLVRMLSNYDPKQMHYIGSHSESHVQNTRFSYSMAYGGGGFAISYPLARALATTQDGCLNRYCSSLQFRLIGRLYCLKSAKLIFRRLQLTVSRASNSRKRNDCHFCPVRTLFVDSTLMTKCGISRRYAISSKIWSYPFLYVIVRWCFISTLFPDIRSYSGVMIGFMRVLQNLEFQLRRIRGSTR